jgi:NAD(P)-dependent dehydrogenase (short-subunit alcohol dehydrogenase family)
MSSTRTELLGRTALVTGGGAGIGRVIAVELGVAGARVAVVARSRGQADRTARAIEEAGGVAWPFPVDITDVSSVDALIRKVSWRLGPVDILVNNAAPGPAGFATRLGPVELAATLTLSVTASLAMTAAVLPGMRDRRWGRVIQASAVSARPASTVGWTSCVAAGAAIEASTVSLAAQLAGTGVTVNAYRQGPAYPAADQWLRSHDPATAGYGGAERFREARAAPELLTAQQFAISLVSRLSGDQNGAIWDINDDLPGTDATPGVTACI